MHRSSWILLIGFVVGCAGTLETRVETASDTGRYPEGLSVVYDDRTPLFGGDRVEVAADGAVRWWTEVPSPIAAGGTPEDTLDDSRQMPPSPERAPDVVGQVSTQALGRLLALLDAIAPWDRPRDDEDDVRLERRRALLELRLGSERLVAWQWADPTESGDHRITAIRRWTETEVERPRPAPPEEEPVEPVDEGPNPMLRNP